MEDVVLRDCHLASRVAQESSKKRWMPFLRGLEGNLGITDQEKHNRNLQNFMSIGRECGLISNIDKSKICVKSINYFGMV